jgi:hypothetical protein
MTSDGVKAFHLVTIKRQNKNWRIAGAKWKMRSAPTAREKL